MHFSTFIQQTLQCLIIFYGRRRKWRSGGTIFRGQHGTWQNEAAIPQIKPSTPFATGQCKTHRTDTKWNQEQHVLDVILRRHSLTQKHQGRRGRLEGKSFNNNFFWMEVSASFTPLLENSYSTGFLCCSRLLVNKESLNKQKSFVKSRYTKQSESELLLFVYFFPTK